MIIIFDFDGTIHQTELAYKYALEESLRELNLDINDFDYKSFIGMGPKDVWDKILNDNSNKDELIRKNGDRIIENMKSHGRLYDGVYETLAYLKDKYDLYILSKCRNVYMDEARKFYGLDKYFSKYLISESYDFIDKYKILAKEIKEDYIMIGDRQEDIEAATRNNKEAIFAAYGYGSLDEAKGAKYIVDSIRELKNIL